MTAPHSPESQRLAMQLAAMCENARQQEGFRELPEEIRIAVSLLQRSIREWQRELEEAYETAMLERELADHEALLAEVEPA